MKNLKKAELTVIALTVLCLIFTAGYFIGRGAAVQVISFEKLAPPPAAATENPGSGPDTDTSGEAAEASVPVNDAGPAASSPVPSPSAPVSAGDSGQSGKININTATSDELDMLPGIGPVLARSIMDYREKNGGFKTIEQIKDVDGIGEKKFDAMKDMITVG